VAEFPFVRSTVTIANASLLNDLESARAAAGGSSLDSDGMLPQRALRTADVTVCYQFQPFHEVGGDFLDFFTPTDGVIGICLGDVTGKGKGLPAALYAALAVRTLRGVHNAHGAGNGFEHSQPESDVTRRVAALRCGAPGRNNV
jgi:hypothetical protein